MGSVAASPLRDGKQLAYRLFAAIDAALEPAGVPKELSRIIAQFAQSVRWAEDRRFAIDSDGCTVALMQQPSGSDFAWAFSDVSIGNFPSPSSSTPMPNDCKDRSSLRVWTIRIERSDYTACMGIAKPSPAPNYDPNRDVQTISVTTCNSAVYRGADTRPIAFPRVSHYPDAVGSLYHFTADLSIGAVRVRPVITRLSPVYVPPSPPQTEWTIAEGVSDLAEYRATVAMLRVQDGCTILWSTRGSTGC